MSASENDHGALLHACAAGDRASLRRLMDLEGARMLGVARRMLRRQDLAEDAVQDSFIAIWRKAGQFDPARGSARGWVYTILRNRCLTLLRDADRGLVEPGHTPDSEENPDDLVLDAAYSRLDMDSDLRRCLGALEPSRRMAILSSYVLGYSHGEISGRMKAPLGSVKAWVRRGLAQLRECLS